MTKFVNMCLNLKDQDHFDLDSALDHLEKSAVDYLFRFDRKSDLSKFVVTLIDISNYVAINKLEIPFDWFVNVLKEDFTLLFTKLEDWVSASLITYCYFIHKSADGSTGFSRSVSSILRSILGDKHV